MIQPTFPRCLQFLSLGQRLALIYSLGVSVLLGLGAFFSYTALVETLETDAHAFVLSKAHAVGLLLENSDRNRNQLRSEIEWQLPELQYNRIFARIYHADGTVFAETAGIGAEVPRRSPAELRREYTKPVRFRSAQGTALLGYALAKPPYTVEIAMDLSRLDQTRRQHGNVVLSLALAGLVIALGLGALLGRLIVQPVLSLVAETRKLKPEHPFEIHASDFPAELRPIAEALNTLHRRVRAQVHQLSSFAEDLAHEMRNPINILIGESEVALSKPRSPSEYRSTLESALEEYRDLSRLVDSLLFIARAENSALDILRETISVSEVCHELVEIYLPAAEENKMDLRYDAADDFTIVADRLLLKRALANLISNAIFHGNRGSSIRVTSIRTGEGITLIRIRDEGPGIAPDHIPRLFDRFFRVNAARINDRHPGSGLGLAIVRSIMALHRGEVRVVSEIGVGSEFILSFPPQ